MDAQYIYEIVKDKIRNNKLTYDDFDELFSDILTLREEYDVINTLYDIGVEVVDEINSNEEPVLLKKVEKFDESGNKSNIENSVGFHNDTVFTNNDLKQSNEILCVEIQKGSQQAITDLCMKNKNLVYKYVKNYKKIYRNLLDEDDLFQIGIMGMITAAKKFDISLGNQFTTYAIWWIKQSITRAICDEGFIIRIPVHKMEQIMSVFRRDQQLALLNNNPHERKQIIAKEKNISIEEVEELFDLKKNFLNTSSLDTPIGEDGETSILDILDVKSENHIEDIIYSDILKDAINVAMADLKDKEKDVLNRRYGLNGYDVQTLEEIGQIYGVTRERIRQIEDGAIRKLRVPRRKKQIKDFYIDED